jgi:hypothetical protein
MDLNFLANGKGVNVASTRFHAAARRVFCNRDRSGMSHGARNLTVKFQRDRRDLYGETTAVQRVCGDGTGRIRHARVISGG